MAEDKKKVEAAEFSEPKQEKKEEKKSVKKAAKKGSVKPLLKDFDIVLRPVVTEKSQNDSEHNKVTFVVRKDATKPEIKQAVERIFGVTVLSINTLIRKGKQKRFRGTTGKQVDLKRAIITLPEGQNIDVAENI